MTEYGSQAVETVSIAAVVLAIIAGCAASCGVVADCNNRNDAQRYIAECIHGGVAPADCAAAYRVEAVSR